MRRVIRDAFVVTADEPAYLDTGTVVIDDERIGEVSEFEPGRSFPKADEVIDGAGTIVMPGLVNAHTHMEASAMSGVFSDLGVGGLALQMAGMLNRFLSDEFDYLVRAGWRLGALLHIKSGITALNSMDIRPSVGADILAKAGLRATLGVLVGDYFLDSPVDRQAERAESFIKAHHDTHDGRLRASIAPHGDLWCTERVWSAARRLADDHPGVLVHTHLNEMPESRSHAQYAGHDDPVDLLESYGLLDERLCAAHFRKADRDEARRLGRADAGAVHCPTIISYWSSGDGGWMPVESLREAGANVGLGLDDAYWHDSFDLFDEAKHARLFANHYNGTPSLETADLINMLTAGGARSMGIGGEVGRVAEGCRADLTVIDADRSWLIPGTNIPARVVNSITNRDVTSVMVDGEFLMRQGDVLSMNESDVLGQARDALQRFDQETSWTISPTGADVPTLAPLSNMPNAGPMRLLARLGWQQILK